MTVWDSQSPWCGVSAFAACAFGGWIFSRWMDLPENEKPIHSLDGLRGVLAVLVFIHHAMRWFYIGEFGTWGLPRPDIYTTIGKGGVAIFFMITALLFLRKTKAMPNEDRAWWKLLVGRVYRLMPLYWIQIALMVGILVWQTGIRLNEPPMTVLGQLCSWIFCVIGGSRDVNGYRETWMITAGVGWSLAYEWLFYVGLPFAAIALGTRVPKKVILISAALVGVLWWLINPFNGAIAAFGGGGICFLALRVKAIEKFAGTWLASAVVLVLLVVSFCCFPEFFKPVPLLLSSFAFTLICMGNDVFGILRSRALRTLGELSYGFYLFHGLFLYVVFRLGGLEKWKLSPVVHWTVIAILCPVIIGACFFLNRFVERPAMNLNPFVRKRVANAHKVVPS